MKLLSIALAAALAIGALAQGQPKRGNVPVKGGRKLALGRSNACAKICAAKKRSRNGGKQLRNKRGGKNKQPQKRGGNKTARKNLGKKMAKRGRHAEDHVPDPYVYVYPTYGPIYEPEEYVPEVYVPQECQPMSEQFKFYLSDQDVADKLGITIQDAAALMSQGKNTVYQETGIFTASDGTTISFEAKSHSIIVTQICVVDDYIAPYPITTGSENVVPGTTYNQNNPQSGGYVYPTGGEYVYYDYQYGVRSGKKRAKKGGKKLRAKNPKQRNLNRNKKTLIKKKPKTRRGPKGKVQGKVQRAGRRQAPKCRC